MIDDAAFPKKYVEQMKTIEENILDFLDAENPQDFEKINELINNIELEYKKQNSNEILHLLITIAENHHRTPYFYDKIWNIMKPILPNMDNYDLFNFFKDQKLLLLYLFQNKIIQPTKQLFDIILSDEFRNKGYDYYFFPEFKHFYENHYFDSWYKKREEFYNSDDSFGEKRKAGENDCYICQLIRNDSVEEFITYVNKNNITLSNQIESSVYETNSFLLDRQPTIIEYATFYGSIQIFRYLMMNQVRLTPELRKYAIHGKNPLLIHLLEENDIKFTSNDCYIESVKCHHNEIAAYIKNQQEKEDNKLIMKSCLQYYNYVELSNFDFKSFDSFEIFQNFVEYDFTLLAKYSFDKNSINKHGKYKKKVYDIAFMAILNGNIEILKLVIGDIDVNQKRNYFNETVFHIVIQNRKIDIVKLLLEPPYNANINMVIFGGGGEGIGGRGFGNGEKNSLHIAIQNEDVKMVDLLLKNDKIDVNAMFVQEIITNQGINCDIKELTPLFMAVELQNIEIVKLLLEHKNIDVNKRSLKVFYYNYKKKIYTHSRCGCFWNNYSNQRMIGERWYRDEDKNYYDDDENYVEVYDRDSEINRLYRSGGVKTPLHAAIELKNIPIIQLLLSHQKIDVNKRSINYMPYKKFVTTPLYDAYELKDEEIKQLLLKNKKIAKNKKSSFYKEQSKKDISDKRVFELECEKTPFDISS